MQRFKNNMSDGWLFRQELRFFRNFMRNWKRDVDDSDFFDIFANSSNTTENEAKAFLKKYFSLETLAKCDSVGVERVFDKANDEGRIVDFSLRRCSTDGLLRELWNKDKESRARCREMLEEWCDVLEKHKSRTCRRKDPIETRMDFFAVLFGGMGSSGSEKGVINSILDETKLPAIWISNAPAMALDDSVRRRFDYSIRFDKLGTRQRSAIWRNSVKKFRLERLVPAELAEQFAQKYQTSAGGIAMVLENVKRMHPRKDMGTARNRQDRVREASWKGTEQPGGRQDGERLAVLLGRRDGEKHQEGVRSGGSHSSYSSTILTRKANGNSSSGCSRRG